MILNADGGCHPNPGRGRYGFIAKHNGVVVFRKSVKIGQATCNIAEWRGALAALEYGLAFTGTQPEPVELRMDSQLVVHQLNGVWKTKHKGLQPLQQYGQRLLTLFRERGVPLMIRWVPREDNQEADALTGPRR